MLELKELQRHLTVGRGVEEKVLGNMDEVETNWNESVVQKYFAEPGDLPDVTDCPLPVQMQCYCLLYVAFGWYLTGQLFGTCTPPQCMHRFAGMENLSACCCSCDSGVGPLPRGHRAGTCPSFLHFLQNGCLRQSHFL